MFYDFPWFSYKHTFSTPLPFFKQQQEQKRRKWPQKMSLKYRFNDFQLLLWSNCALLWLETSPFWDLLWYFLLLFTVLAPGLLLNYLLAIPPQWSVLLNNDKANCLPWTNLAKNLTFLSLNINWFFFSTSQLQLHSLLCTMIFSHGKTLTKAQVNRRHQTMAAVSRELSTKLQEISLSLICS